MSGKSSGPVETGYSNGKVNPFWLAREYCSLFPWATVVTSYTWTDGEFIENVVRIVLKRLTDRFSRMLSGMQPPVNVVPDDYKPKCQKPGENGVWQTVAL